MLVGQSCPQKFWDVPWFCVSCVLTHRILVFCCFWFCSPIKITDHIFLFLLSQGDDTGIQSRSLFYDNKEPPSPPSTSRCQWKTLCGTQYFGSVTYQPGCTGDCSFTYEIEIKRSRKRESHDCPLNYWNVEDLRDGDCGAKLVSSSECGGNGATEALGCDDEIAYQCSEGSNETGFRSRLELTFEDVIRIDNHAVVLSDFSGYGSCTRSDQKGLKNGSVLFNRCSFPGPICEPVRRKSQDIWKSSIHLSLTKLFSCSYLLGKKPEESVTTEMPSSMPTQSPTQCPADCTYDFSLPPATLPTEANRIIPDEWLRTS